MKAAPVYPRTMRRFLAFPLVRLAVIVLIFVGVTTPILFGVRSYHSTGLTIVVTWLLLALLLGSIALVERYTTGKSLGAIGFDPQNAGRDFMLGAALGAVLFSIVVLELALAGYYHVLAIHPTRSLAVAALVLLPSAAIEELLFRGVVFRLIEEWSGTWIALAISSAIFGMAHAANPGATWVSSLAIALEAGVLLGLAFVVMRNLWFPIGLHFAWNFFEGPIYGTEISGRSLFAGALTAHVSGPAFLTGGSFGPEAGFAAILTCVVASGGLAYIALRRSSIAPPNWKMTPEESR